MANNVFQQLNTARARLAKIQAQIGALEIEAARFVNPSDLEQGVAVLVDYGRGDKARELAGVVLGTKVTEKGTTLVRVKVGNAFDAETITVHLSQIKEVFRG